MCLFYTKITFKKLVPMLKYWRKRQISSHWPQNFDALHRIERESVWEILLVPLKNSGMKIYFHKI